MAAAFEPYAVASLLPEPLAAISGVVEAAIQVGEAPGAVVLIGHEGQIAYRRAFGLRRHGTPPQPMTADTLFDLASLTKVIATAPAVMQLAEKGRLELDRPAAAYWPDFKGHGKDRITLRQLLTHYSGLRPGLLPAPPWSGYAAALARIAADTPPHPPDARFVYSDLNFVVLGEIVRRMSGEGLDEYCRRNLFWPLGMQDTGFKPLPALFSRMAPTMEGSRGAVHDPHTRRMGGISGAAGLFATADDLAKFAQALLDGGVGQAGRLLEAESIARMVSAQSPPGRLPQRGLGWAIASSGGNWAGQLPAGSFGHKGFTGTLIWIDPQTRTYLIVLANRVYPDGEARPETLRDRLFSLAVQATGRPAAEASGSTLPAVQTGVDVLSATGFAPLKGRRVGLITNHTGRDAAGRRTIDLLAAAPGVKLKAIFSPEHGLSGAAEGKVAGSRDAATRLPISSLYGENLRPRPEQLKDLDALVFDVQDAGARFYTYMTTMAYAMEAAAKKGIEFWVLDRPNPIGADRVEGPVMDADLKSFTGYFPLPVRHGMTLGELARLFNAENRIGAKLKVVAMKGYRREMWFDETGITWVNPSPNLRSLTQAILYPGVALAEASNLNVGRGTATPFEVLGAPWIHAPELAAALNRRGIAGVEFEAATFTPVSDRYKGQVCQGVRLRLTDRGRLDSVGLGIEILSALQHLYPGVFQLEKALGLVGSRAVLNAIRSGEDPRAIALSWQDALENFKSLRGRYLLY